MRRPERRMISAWRSLCCPSSGRSIRRSAAASTTPRGLRRSCETIETTSSRCRMARCSASSFSRISVMSVKVRTAPRSSIPSTSGRSDQRAGKGILLRRQSTSSAPESRGSPAANAESTGDSPRGLGSPSGPEWKSVSCTSRPRISESAYPSRSSPARLSEVHRPSRSTPSTPSPVASSRESISRRARTASRRRFSASRVRSRYRYPMRPTMSIPKSATRASAKALRFCQLRAAAMSRRPSCTALSIARLSSRVACTSPV